MSWLLDFEVVSLLEILPNGNVLLWDHDWVNILELNVDDFVVTGLAIISHNDFVDKLVLDDSPFLLSFFVCVELVDFVDGGENSLVAHDFFGGVNSQIDAPLKLHEVGLVTREHHEVLNFFLVVDVEVFSRPSNLNVIDSGH